MVFFVTQTDQKLGRVLGAGILGVQPRLELCTTAVYKAQVPCFKPNLMPSYDAFVTTIRELSETGGSTF